MNDDKVIIKCFETPGNNYFYDRYTDSVIRVSDDEYRALERLERGEEQSYDKQLLKKYKNNGLLHNSILKGIEHPDLKNIEHFLNNNMSQLILQVTQQCNLRCDYCAYSGGYYNRKHETKAMTFEVAKKAMDFYVQHSNETNMLTVGFYGGEPLISFSLIKKCVLHLIEVCNGKELSFGLTTNGTLLTDEIVDYLVKYDFSIMISLDGPQKEHDINRKFISGKGSFNTIISNLERLQERYPQFYKRKITFNTVINTKSDLNAIMNYFEKETLFPDGANSLNFVSPNGLVNEELAKYNIEFYRVYWYEYLKMLLALLKKIEWDKRRKLLRSHVEEIKRTYIMLHNHKIEFSYMHHNGPCLPGVRRLFVNVDGIFYPCERVSETSDDMIIGNLDNGFDLGKIEYLINHGRIIEDKCLNCWNLRRCSFCLGNAEMNEEFLIDRECILQECKDTKTRSLSIMHQLCVLNELGLKLPVEDTYEKINDISI
ncbi:Cys-rich peptide radical SAM maturase CcpM [Blautia schinkii]|nr:Cys-rich peptide radical SAM maturase CcpM [Blautia schinkii]